MPRHKSLPKYGHHRPSGQARTIIDGRQVYLGKFGSPESKAKYAQIIAERVSASQLSTEPPPSGIAVGLTVDEILLRYWTFAETYYVKDGRPTKELSSMREALRHLRPNYGAVLASDFGPLRLKAVRQQMIDANLSRGVINSRINRIKRVFKWAVSEQLVPPHVYEALRTVSGLRFGRCTARETEPVRPVDDTAVDAVLPFVSPPVAAMISLQRLTGMRPCEVVLMRPCDIDKTGETWLYEPSDHKNRWRGHRRVVPLGPRARTILTPFLNRDSAAYLFSPIEAEAWRNERRTGVCSPDRKTPVYPSELRRRERDKQNRRKKPSKRPKRERYDVDSYRRAIEYGIRMANRACPTGTEVPHWHPNQLRHSFATAVRAQFGVEAAQVGLGHARTDVVEIYAEKNLSLATQVASQVG